MNLTSARARLQAFDFHTLFIESLGWNQPGDPHPRPVTLAGQAFTRTVLAELGGVPVIELVSAQGIPPAEARAAVYAALPQAEKLAVFVDAARQNSVWRWHKRTAPNKTLPREHFYARAQPGDLFLSKLAALLVDIKDLQAGPLTVTAALDRLRAALDVERVTKKFYAEFETTRLAFTDLIAGIDDDHDRRWYASALLNRLMFIYFLQRKGFLDGGDVLYLQNRLTASQQRGPDRYYAEFLRALFFQAFARRPADRDPQARALTGSIPYLNGGLFLPHPVEQRWPDIRIPDQAFASLLGLFARYSWNLDDAPGGKDDEINPAVLGYIFEKYINQKAFGAYYTRPEITAYVCERALERAILDRVNAAQPRPFAALGDLFLALNAPLCRLLLDDVLPALAILDPACGSGAFLVAAMQTLINVYSKVIGQLDFETAPDLRARREAIRRHPSVAYFIKRAIITRNLYGVDIMPEAVEIARLRLFLALVASAARVEELEPLPNIDFNIMAGNALVGLLRVDEDEFNRRQPGLFAPTFRQLVAERERLVARYQAQADTPDSVDAASAQLLRDDIARKRAAAYDTLNDLLVTDFQNLGIKFEQAVWNAAANAPGKPLKRAVTLADVAALSPFHWGYEFDAVMNGRGGFDVIVTNPPWEIFKPQAKEFFAEYSDVVTKNKMTIKAFEKEQAALLKNKAVRQAWLAYQSRFPHLSAYFRAAPQYAHQVAVINGKKAASDINLYKLFVEQCFNLLRPGGQAGLILPSGIYTDLGAKALRELLFDHTTLAGLFGFENREEIFEGVDSRFKFVALTFAKGGRTTAFPAAFMRRQVAELADFPAPDTLRLSVALIRRLSPESLSIMEFHSPQDVAIAEKMLRWPLLGEAVPGAWQLKLTREFDMTNDSALFRTAPGPGRLPLFEGKMIHQFTHQWGEPRYWVNEKQGRQALLGKTKDAGQTLDYQRYRLAHRSIARNTDQRTMIASIIPANVFCGNSLITSVGENYTMSDLLWMTTCLNSFVVDWLLRQKVTTNINMFYIYQLPVPRLTAADARFGPIVQRAGRLVCTTPEFDGLARAVGLGSHRAGARDEAERAALRAELDARVARLYGLTEAELRHVLAAFPLVGEEIKAGVMRAFTALAGEAAG